MHSLLARQTAREAPRAAGVVGWVCDYLSQSLPLLCRFISKKCLLLCLQVYRKLSHNVLEGVCRVAELRSYNIDVKGVQVYQNKYHEVCFDETRDHAVNE